MKKYYYSEIFKSIQGEGAYTGVNTVWLRFFSCNLQCDGFGQEDPTNPKTYKLPYKKYDLIDVKKIEDLPVWDKGCDSSYSWSKKYKHLCHYESSKEIAKKIKKLLPDGKFVNNKKGINIHLAFTGGEPMLQQEAIIDIWNELCNIGANPHNITIETNGTVPLKEKLANKILSFHGYGGEWFWSISPKLFRVSGEKSYKAIKPKVISFYQNISQFGQIKPVLNDDFRAWAEFEGVLSSFIYHSDLGKTFPVYVMPIGATKESQKKINRIIVELSMERGWNFSSRLHTHLFNNTIGT